MTAADARPVVEGAGGEFVTEGMTAIAVRKREGRFATPGRPVTSPTGRPRSWSAGQRSYDGDLDALG